jgi:hypothetical protein
MLRIIIGAGVIVSLLTGAALAQLPMGISLGHDEKHKLTPEEQAKQDAADRAYKSTLQKIPEKKAVDPWGNIRDPGPAPQTSQTTTKNKQQ